MSIKQRIENMENQMNPNHTELEAAGIEILAYGESESPLKWLKFKGDDRRYFPHERPEWTYEKVLAVLYKDKPMEFNVSVIDDCDRLAVDGVYMNETG